MKKNFSFQWLSKYRGVLMGVQILSIMFFHFAGDCTSADVYQNIVLKAIYKIIGSSGVDVFLMLSGIGLYFAWKKNQDHKTFYKRRFRRLLIPYMLTSVPALFMLDIVAKKRGWLYFLKDVTFVSFFETGMRWFWYILMMGICYLIYPYLFEIIEQAQDRVTEKMRVLLLCVTVTLAALFLKLYAEDLYSNISLALYRFPAFFVGCLLGKSTYEKREMPAWKPWLWMILAVTALVPLKMVKVAILHVYLKAFLNFSLCLIFLQMLEWMTGRENRLIGCAYHKLKAILEWFGRYSLEFYLIHLIIRRFALYIKYPTYTIRYGIIMLAISILLSILVGKLTEWIQKILNSIERSV